MKTKNIISIFTVLTITVLLTMNCDHFGTIRDTVGGLSYSIQVNNRSSITRGIAMNSTAEDKIELFILEMSYDEDRNPRGLILVSDGDRDMGSKGGILRNAGWYSIETNLQVTNDVNNGPYSSFSITIKAIRITKQDGLVIEWDFLGGGAVLGKPNSRTHTTLQFPNNFSGITITNSVHSLKTVITVDPGIIDESGNLSSDPYSFIHVKGIINE